MPEDNQPRSPSNAYTPTTQLSSIQNDQPQADEISEPKDIPVPTDDDDDDDDDDDELSVEECWVIQKDKLIRLHCKPRCEAFDPSTCNDCPVDILSVSGERARQAMQLLKKCGLIGTLGSSCTMTQPWTGVTIFSAIECDQDLPDVEDLLHVEDHQGLSCEIFLTQEDLDATVREPQNFPALIASAAKRQRAEIKVKDLSTEEISECKRQKTKNLING